MDFSKFKETEQKYRNLKEKLSNGEITPEEMKKELKKMMVLDENGTYWMIGGKTGKWYVHNGTEWIEENPFQEKPQSTAEYTEPAGETTEDTENASAGVDSGTGTGVGTGAVAFTGPGNAAYIDSADRSRDESMAEEEEGEEEENIDRDEYESEEPFVLDVTGEISSREAPTPVMLDESADMGALGNEKDQPDRYTICKICKSKISKYSIYCPVCGVNQKEAAAPPRKLDRTVVKENELLIASVKIGSLIFFLGTLGLIVGLFCGAVFGIFKTLIPEFQPLLPEYLSEMRGKLSGGMFFAMIWGIAGLTIAAVTAVVLGIIYNSIASFVGGIRFKIKQ